MGFRTFAVVLAPAAALILSLAPMPVDAQSRGVAQGRPGGRGQTAARQFGPREIQAQFDAYVIGQAETVLRISEEQYPQFVRRVRALQTVRRTSRMQRNRMIGQLNQMLRAGTADETRLVEATRAIDEHERTRLAALEKAYAGIDEVLTPWQRARFRVLEDHLEQKKLEMLLRAQQGPRR
ncbi:MAG: hypothetical protein WD690_18765 [Vicinamibacterales bacterium]